MGKVEYDDPAARMMPKLPTYAAPLPPLYATEIRVTSTSDEVILDFYWQLPPEPPTHLARFVVSRAHITRLLPILSKVTQS